MHHSNKKIPFLLNSVTLQAEYTLEKKREDRMLLCAVYSVTVINCRANKLRCVCSGLSKSPKFLIYMTSLNEIQSIPDGMEGFQIYR